MTDGESANCSRAVLAEGMRAAFSCFARLAAAALRRHSSPMAADIAGALLRAAAAKHLRGAADGGVLAHFPPASDSLLAAIRECFSSADNENNFSSSAEGEHNSLSPADKNGSSLPTDKNNSPSFIADVNESPLSAECENNFFSPTNENNSSFADKNNSLPVAESKNNSPSFAGNENNLPLFLALRELSPFLFWRAAGNGQAAVAAAELVGPSGVAECSRFRAGVFFQPRRMFYEWHRHAAEELYLPLFGTAKWFAENAAAVCKPPLSFIHHHSWRAHAMQTFDSPLCAVWGWRGDIAMEHYEFCAPPTIPAP